MTELRSRKRAPWRALLSGCIASVFILLGQGTAASADEMRERSPYRGGSWIGLEYFTDTGSIGLSHCTGGFLMRRVSDARRFGVTANHCVGTRSSTVFGINLGGQRSGYTHGVLSATRYSTTYDVAAWSLKSGTYDTTSRVLTSGTTSRRVTGELPSSQQKEGDQVCGVGWGNATYGEKEKCGIIKYVNITLKGVAHLNCFERRTYSGDSGGPVYQLNSDGSVKAAGITKLSWKKPLTPFPARYYWCYVPIDYVENALDLQVVMNG